MRAAAVIGATVLLASALSGCQSQSQKVSDISASAIALPTVHSTERAKFSRVVALANGSAEIVAALGYSSILVGRDVASTLPEFAAIPIDNPGHTISPELVLSQRPDLIIIDANSSPQTAISVLQKSGIAIVKISDSFNLSAIVTKEAAIAEAIGVPIAGKRLESQVSSTTFPKGKIKVLFLYLRGTASIYLIGGKGSGADSLFSAMGFRDIGAENLSQPFSAMSAEELIKLDPDVIVLMSKGLQSVGGVDGLIALPGVAQTRAGRERRVTTVDDSLLLSFGPRTPELVRLLRSNIMKAAA